jgi:hypothetical protein
MESAGAGDDDNCARYGVLRERHTGAIAAGNTTVILGTGGSLTVGLAPNLGSTPMGNYYTAVYHLNDGETSREYCTRWKCVWIRTSGVCNG